MLFRSFLLLVGASLQTLYVVAAQNPKEHYSKPAPEISPYPEPKPTSWLSKPKPTWTLEPSRLVPSPPFSMPTPWPSSVLIDPNPTWEPQPTVNEPSESQTTPWEPSPSHSVPQKLARPKPPKNARPAEHDRSFMPSSRCSSEINREAFNQGVNYGKVFVQYSLVGREDCTKYKNTLKLLEQTGPMSPIYPTREPLPTYCKKYGFYQAFASAVADFEKVCSGCPFKGYEIGHRAGALFCNFPSFINIEECSHKPAQTGCYSEFYWALLDLCGVNYLQMFNSPRAMELRQRLSCHQ